MCAGGVEGSIGFSLPCKKKDKFELGRQRIYDLWERGEAVPFEMLEQFVFRMIRLTVMYPHISGLLPHSFRAVGIIRGGMSSGRGVRSREACGARVAPTAALVLENRSVDFLRTEYVVLARGARHLPLHVHVCPCAAGYRVCWGSTAGGAGAQEASCPLDALLHLLAVGPRRHDWRVGLQVFGFIAPPSYYRSVLTDWMDGVVS